MKYHLFRTKMLYKKTSSHLFLRKGGTNVISFLLRMKTAPRVTLACVPLVNIVTGERREELTLKEIYKRYDGRGGLEHFFRFGKQKLLMNSCKRSAILKLCLNLSMQMSLRYMRMSECRYAICEFLMLLLYFFRKLIRFWHLCTKKVFKIRENLSDP